MIFSRGNYYGGQLEVNRSIVLIYNLENNNDILGKDSASKWTKLGFSPGRRGKVLLNRFLVQQLSHFMFEPECLAG